MKDIIRTARDIIAKKENWTQGKLARNQNGHPVWAMSPAATCWCAIGALRLAATRLGLSNKELDDAMDFFHQTNQEIARFNDTHTHEEVLALFDQVIERAQS